VRVLTPAERGQTLRRLRLAAGLGQRRLARAAKLEARTVADLEHGRQPLGLKRARRLAKALGVKVDALLFGDDLENQFSSPVAE
jgi:transcriptional regulator with XRE-family HTH domain